MAGVNAAAAISAAATTSSPFPPPSPITGKSRILSSTLPSSFPQRERRTNHLRKKILKTLETKPYPDPSDPSNPQYPLKTHTIPIQETTQQQTTESEHVSISEPAGFIDGIMGTFSTKSFGKIGLYLVGAFVFQTVCAVLIFGLNDLDDKDDILNDNNNDHKNEKKANPKSNLKLRSDLLSGNRNAYETKDDAMVLVDETEMDSRIMEIQEMARRAREQEKTEAKRRGLVDEESDGIDFDLIEKSVKKKEVGDRLMKLRNGLEGEYKKDESKARRTNGGDGDLLMFKKKYKYKSPSVDSGDKPKGFSGAKDVRDANGSVINGVSVSKDENKEEEHRASKTESIAGTLKEPTYDKQTSKGEKSGKSNNLETKKPRGFGKESNDTGTSTKHDDVNKNGSLKGKKGTNKKPAKLEDKSRTQTEFWWTRLPYVMAVEMRSGGDGEKSSGFFVIRNISGPPHTIAFEDRSDATNFCYLLESFFEGLNNFRTNLIPIPTNELEKEVKSQILKVFVVKKGQLKLYIGQPLEDVESALRNLIEQQGDD